MEKDETEANKAHNVQFYIDMDHKAEISQPQTQKIRKSGNKSQN
jgi:hypothetical protein